MSKSRVKHGQHMSNAWVTHEKYNKLLSLIQLAFPFRGHSVPLCIVVRHLGTTGENGVMGRPVPERPSNIQVITI